MIRVIVSLLILVFADGCTEDDTRVVSEPGPPEFPYSLIPLAVGNSWTYIDSLLSDSASSAETYTIAIESARVDSDRVWWQFRDSRIPTYYIMELTVRNDSIFSLQYNEDVPVVSLEYIPPPDVDTLHFFSLFGGDVTQEKAVYRLAGDCAVPAGTFDSCVVYYWVDSALDFTEILKPSIGLIKRQFHNSLGEHQISLTDYTLKR